MQRTLTILWSVMEKFESLFPTIIFLVHKILGIVGSQIEIEIFFPWLKYQQI
jgi:hypothetical protein